MAKQKKKSRSSSGDTDKKSDEPAKKKGSGVKGGKPGKKKGRSGKKTVRKRRRVVTKPAPKRKEHRDIGLPVGEPSKICEDVNCPFHGSLSVRGQILEGEVAKIKSTRTAVVKRERLHYLPKYERYERRKSRHTVHNPTCLDVKVGDRVKIGECRPLSKTKSFVIIERRP